MCVPVAALPIIAAAAGTGLSVVGKLYEGQQASALAEANAKAYEQAQEAERRASGFEIAQRERGFQRARGQAIAAVGASGVGLAGSPTEVIADNAGEHQLDLEAIRYGSKIKQNQLGTQADISRFQGRSSRFASYIGAASELAGGISSFYDPTKSIKFGGSMFARQGSIGNQY